ncbi:hypothetical protein [Kutzneria chonburiensis]|uniref:DUF5009 domain-containing protein n=1 Tax=Kutzneria chonburiensis TaxID=1483604 RepID=A0ABV6MTW1_9PSEU|nr:hypothetical protein [Kutzneria chonburiensis]
MSREQHYRRLLRLYPQDHRATHGEEMLGVLMAGGGGRRDDLNLVGGAIALHTRRMFNLDGGVPLRDVMAIVSLLGPIILLTGAASDLHEIAWWIKGGDLADIPYTQIPESPAWAAWLVVALLALSGMRRLAALMSWVAVLTLLVIITEIRWNYSGDPSNVGWMLLGLITAISLTWSAGPKRGLELVGRRGVLFALAGVATSTLLVAISPSLYRLSFAAYQLGPWLAVAAIGLAAYLACNRVPHRRTGRHAAFLLAVPVLSDVWQYLLMEIVGAPLFWIGIVENSLFYGVPLLIVLAANGILRTIKKSLPS